MEEIKNVNLTQLKPFKNHPFSVNFDKDFIELMKSIDKEGVIVPLLARPNPNGEGYELISGHRRKMVCEELGIEEIPVVIREMNDEQAIIAMVDINLMQREKIKLSEKAFALKMKLEAMSRQGQRSDLTSGQVDQKLKNRNVKTYGIEIEKKDNEELVFRNSEKTTNSYSSRKELAMQIGESERQIQRYIRLTNLIPQILEMVDAERIAFTVAVELSYLKETEQYELYAVMDLEQCTPSLTQAHRMKMSSQSGNLDMDNIYCILEEEKPNQKEKIKILSKYDQIKKLLSKYPKEMTAEDTSYQGIVVIEYDSFGKGSKKLWNQFLKNVKDHKDCAIVICQYTVEGDPILQYVSNVNGKFYYVEDSTRDAYGSEKYVQYTYDYYKIYKQDGHYTVILTMDNKLTFDEAQDVRSLKTAIQLLDVKQ